MSDCREIRVLAITPYVSLTCPLLLQKKHPRPCVCSIPCLMYPRALPPEFLSNPHRRGATVRDQVHRATVESVMLRYMHHDALGVSESQSPSFIYSLIAQLVRRDGILVPSPDIIVLLPRALCLRLAKRRFPPSGISTHHAFPIETFASGPGQLLNVSALSPPCLCAPYANVANHADRYPQQGATIVHSHSNTGTSDRGALGLFISL
ncbi:hypothetical protein PYCCODRAFT_841759 [Trametes coccinea BRFM310]|uniref:Uncharacterized protein n=1 Tax=Trametes coccinea (strain BRFM310) TaxID=1353009 RepID=A0A1Y2IFT2_TRAC3|nr:hypothetical protein PYCCODRAFT_841759 [Trametes coccinea BRFM310]